MVYSGWKLGEPNVYCMYLISNHHCMSRGAECIVDIECNYHFAMRYVELFGELNAKQGCKVGRFYELNKLFLFATHVLCLEFYFPQTFMLPHLNFSDKSKARNNSDSKKEPGIPKEPTAHIAAQTFTFRELAAATKNFRPECLIGEGGFGRVYKGKLESGQVC